jgi:hypothetical protein
MIAFGDSRKAAIWSPQAARLGYKIFIACGPVMIAFGDSRKAAIWSQQASRFAALRSCQLMVACPPLKRHRGYPTARTAADTFTSEKSNK